MNKPKHLTLTYFLEKGLSLEDAAMALEAVCSCGIENSKCMDKETVDRVIERIRGEVDSV